jgi:(S)-2-hydroxy-acid oxidase
VTAVGDKMEVYIDSGIRNGTDVFKALALGAKAVFIGRPILWGLAYKVGILLNLLESHIIITSYGNYHLK